MERVEHIKELEKLINKVVSQRLEIEKGFQEIAKQIKNFKMIRDVVEDIKSFPPFAQGGILEEIEKVDDVYEKNINRIDLSENLLKACVAGLTERERMLRENLEKIASPMIPGEQWRRKNNPLLFNAVMKQLRGRE